jgi:hypothetical protein
MRGKRNSRTPYIQRGWVQCGAKLLPRAVGDVSLDRNLCQSIVLQLSRKVGIVLLINAALCIVMIYA